MGLFERYLSVWIGPWRSWLGLALAIGSLMRR